MELADQVKKTHGVFRWGQWGCHLLKRGGKRKRLREVEQNRVGIRAMCIAEAARSEQMVSLFALRKCDVLSKE